ncbi:MAG TPA: YlbF family regulator [Gemmatimonadaceae bacterium]|nr:YlbF family regulator [Gemmatimonadaceae bacterium]
MIEEKARDLGRFIGQSKEYQELKRANDALGQDPDAVKLLKQMEQLRGEAQRMIERGERPTEEMEHQLDDLLSKVQVQPAYQRLIAAQENFDKLMAQANEWILDGIEKGAASPIIMLG